MPLFKDLVDMSHLYKVARVVEVEKNFSLKKLYQHGSIVDLKAKIAEEATRKAKILQDIIGEIGSKDYKNSDSLINSVSQIQVWVKDNIKKLSNRDRELRDMLMHLAGLCSRIRNHLNKTISNDMEKVGLIGHSGRKAGYQFKETEHPRGTGGKFSPGGIAGKVSTGKKISGHQYMTVEGGRKLPSYDIIGGRRVGRGIKVVPEEPSMATARMLGHVTRGMYERTTTDPCKAGFAAAGKVSEAQNRYIVMIESLTAASWK